MSDSGPAIRVEEVSKLYRIGAADVVTDSLASAMVSFIKSPLANYRKYRSLYDFADVGSGSDPDNILWALRDISFNVNEGEVLGIVGSNGAGKSTLLKVLSKITPPTKGKVCIRGRVGSLLEVGTGFHPELTGRDNVYLNGTILGMKKREVDKKFDEIVGFSGMERFLDTPVKRYSSGMRVRLAFSVAAHLDPEILIIDEVLAVGDAAFQQKCLNKMQDVGEKGKTVLFVSHNLPAVTNLCTRAILLENSRIVLDGSPHDVVAHYLSDSEIIPAERVWEKKDSTPGGEVARLKAVRIIDRDGRVLNGLRVDQDIGLQMEYDVLIPNFKILPHFSVVNEEGIVVFTTLELDEDWRYRPRPAGRYISTAWIPANLLNDGMMFVNCYIITRNPNRSQVCEKRVVGFTAIDSMGTGTAREDWAGRLSGVIRPRLEWKTVYHPDRGRKIA